MPDAAVVIGRFQPLHKGHAHLIDYTLERYDDVHVGIGIPDEEGSFDNPLTYAEREQVVEACYDDITIFGVEDQGDDTAWIAEVERYVPDGVEAVTGNDHVASCFEQGGYGVDHLDEDDMLDRETYRGTRVREKAAEGDEWRHLVPDRAEDVLDDIGFGERVADLYED